MEHARPEASIIVPKYNKRAYYTRHHYQARQKKKGGDSRAQIVPPQYKRKESVQTWSNCFRKVAAEGQTFSSRRHQKVNNETGTTNRFHSPVFFQSYQQNFRKTEISVSKIESLKQKLRKEKRQETIPLIIPFRHQVQDEKTKQAAKMGGRTTPRIQV